MPSSQSQPPLRDDAWPRVDRAQAEEHGPWAPTGRWTVLAFSSRERWTALERSLDEAAGAGGAWDLRGIEQLDHVGAQLLWNHWGHQWPAQIDMSDSHRAVLDQVARYTVPLPAPAAKGWTTWPARLLAQGPALLRLGRQTLLLVGQLALDLVRLARAPHRGPWRDFSGHLYRIGATALPITALVGLLIGVVLAYLMSNQLRNYGAESFVVNILGLSILRELGPVLAAVLVAGRSGSAITAQIGVMRVTEELDAMRVMGIPPGYRLVMPRVLALAIVMPLVAIWTSLAALIGGMLAAWSALDIAPVFFWQQLPRAVPFVNLGIALAKSAVFGMMIALIACHHGLRVEPNTESLGRRTTASVVASITMVILVDALFALLFRGVGFR
ncbi:ABC transporter permease [uncultured Pseudacidovorax sp.]|uniref:MlaE family ABC transporter permease n=1 Tax=uncultured Pseudacidovorax sp. TaxID=679313 RepID=UPI0025E53C11|nr:ABC transporter permease [uncultured Pseudacidovorax sp.]